MFPDIASIFKPKPAHTEVRYVHTTRREQTEAQRRQQARKASIVAQLAVYAACTTPEQRRIETEAAFAALRAANSRSMENGRGRG